MNLNYLECPDGTVRVWSDADAQYGAFHVVTKAEWEAFRLAAALFNAAAKATVFTATEAE